MSTTKQQAAIKKVEASPVYRLVLPPDEQAQQLALNRGKMLAAAIEMGASGIPMREADPMRDDFPCGYCSFKTLCIANGPEFGLMFPPIPESMKVPVISWEAA
jgi:hypothetical protein